MFCREYNKLSRYVCRAGNSFQFQCFVRKIIQYPKIRTPASAEIAQDFIAGRFFKIVKVITGSRNIPERWIDPVSIAAATAIIQYTSCFFSIKRTKVQITKRENNGIMHCAQILQLNTINIGESADNITVTSKVS